MNNTSNVLAAASSFIISGTAQAQVAVYEVPADFGTRVLMSDVDPSLPSLEWKLELWNGMGTPNSYESLLLLEPGVGHFDMPGPVVYDYEVLTVTNDWYDDAYNLEAGSVLNDSVTGWFHPSLGDGISSSSSPVIGNFNESSFHCTESRAQSVPNGRVNYIGFRYRLIGAPDWNYGWASFTVGEYINPDPVCIDGNSNEVLSLAEYNMHAIGIQVQPGAPIIVGDTGCDPDLNGDGVLDFFDISEFLSTQPDLNADTVFDFFDVSAFLSAYSQGCP